jgi:alpha-D-xyloside xylohydrolase
MNAHEIISIWSSFGPQTKPYQEMASQNMLFNFHTWPLSGSDIWPPKADYPSGVRVYDAYNPKARDIYWNHLNQHIFSKGMDGWWMDSTEPDHLDFKDSDLNEKTYLGSFRKVRNAFPLMTVGGVYTHQRATTSDKRVFILTRSAFAGQQRYGANTWSGDTQASWATLHNQISAGLNFSLCGIPHWNSDIGGFFLGNYPKKLEDPDYRELYVRWIQFGTFCPMMRSHGADAPREIYQFGKAGEPIYDAINKYIHLRYSLLPYIYSTSWSVTSQQSSFMRALMMDFAQDQRTWDINDEYMFGKSILVAPVTKSSNISKQKSTYLPSGTDWYDFWTNEKCKGGKDIDKEVDIDTLPLYVKAGSIIPFGPDVQYATEKKWDELSIAIYPGADANFALYEDEFDNYNYEKGAYTTIQMKWDDSRHTLTIGKRNGAYPRMLTERSFTIKVINGNTKTVRYNGKSIQVRL